MSTKQSSVPKPRKGRKTSRAGDAHTAGAASTTSKSAQKQPDEVVSKADLSRRLKVSKAMVTKYIARGLPVRKDGKIVTELALAWVKRNVVPERSGNPKVSGRGSSEALADAQARKERAIADLRELEVKRKSGELAPIGEINAWVSGMITKARDILLRMPAELRDRLAQETDPIKCEELMSREVNRSLRELAEFRLA